MIKLFFTKRFTPFFICQFGGALNDNLFRWVMVSMLSFGVLRSDHSGVWIQLAAALFMLPFFLFSAAAGEMADRLPKRPFLLVVKSAEVVVMLLGAVAVAVQNLPLMMLCLFLLGMQSAFFGPMKFALLPALLKEEELLNGNAWISASTFAAILLGSVGGFLAGQSSDYLLHQCAAFILVAVVGLLGAVGTPFGGGMGAPFGGAANDGFAALRREWRAASFPLGKSLRAVFALTRADDAVFYRILAGSWFWLVGVLLMNEFTRFGFATFSVLFAALAVGVLVGAFACFVLFRGEISSRYAPISLLTGGLLLADMTGRINFTGDLPPPGLIIEIAACAAAMTVYVVPLRAAIQVLAKEDERARVIAGYNIFNALFIVVGTLLAAVMHAVAGDAASALIIATAAGLSIAAAASLCLLLPTDTLRRLLRGIFRRLFRVRVRGEENLADGAVVISNHVSLLDGVLLSLFLETEDRRFCFAIDVHQSERPLNRFVLKFAHFYPLNPMEPHAIRGLIRAIKHGDHHLRPMIFPEGRISTSGELMKAYPGAGMVAEKLGGGKVIPVHIDGLQYSPLSRTHGKRRHFRFPAVTIRIGEARSLLPPDKRSRKKQREWMARQTRYILEETAYHARTEVNGGMNLTRIFTERAQLHGEKAPLFCELPDRRLHYRAVYTAAIALGRRLRARHSPGDRIGVLLPSSVGGAVVFYAAVFQGLTPVMLNPGVGQRQALSACQTATLDTVYTSDRLLQRAPSASAIVDTMLDAGLNVIKLESLREEVTVKDKLCAVWAAATMRRSAKALPGYHAAGESPACLLFTSGSEGTPKGVVLSHTNLIHNGEQVISRLDITPADTMLNVLPIFHSFGLLGGIVLPMMTGVPTWQYPTPLHYRLIPEIAYAVNATIFFSANTFLSNYAKYAHAYDFGTLRLVFAGAEKLREETRDTWVNKFGIRILEGYGVTETSPAISVNSPIDFKDGSVGRLLPGVEARLEPVEGVEHGGRLWIRGANVMQGYFLASAPGVLTPPQDGWHDTGDIAEIDADGYVTILGRAKRFIKIAGEMAPLDGIEERLRAYWQGGQFALVGIPDKRRGEMLALLTDTDADRETIAEHLRRDGMPELWQPRFILRVKEFPLLSTGKVDYPGVARLIDEAMEHLTVDSDSCQEEEEDGVT